MKIKKFITMSIIEKVSTNVIKFITMSIIEKVSTSVIKSKIKMKK